MRLCACRDDKRWPPFRMCVSIDGINDFHGPSQSLLSISSYESANQLLDPTGKSGQLSRPVNQFIDQPSRYCRKSFALHQS